MVVHRHTQSGASLMPQGFLLKKLNPSILVMLAVAVVIVVVLDEFKMK